MPDTELIRRFLRGDESAFRALYRRHTPRLRATLLRLLGLRLDQADDAVQETWLGACRGIQAFRGEAQFSTWLITIGIRTARRQFLSGTATEVDMPVDVPAPLGVTAPILIDLERAIAALPGHQRAVLVLHDVEGFTHAEIGHQLGMAEGTSKATLSRARQALRLVLKELVT